MVQFQNTTCLFSIRTIVAWCLYYTLSLIVDCSLLNIQRQIFHSYSERQRVYQYTLYVIYTERRDWYTSRDDMDFALCSRHNVHTICEI